MMKSDITTIILTYNEELHIRRCIENILDLSAKIYVVDCFSSDSTCDICRDYDRVEVVQHRWPGNQAEQFNWALDHLKISSDWILRLDADEYLSKELINEIAVTLPGLSCDICGCVMKRDVIFMGRRIRHGKLKSVRLLRLWRNGKARIENRLMDEHTILISGKSILLKNYFFDENLNGIDAWMKKHIDYSNREMSTILCGGGSVGSKNAYYSLPLFHRAVWFFIFQYILLGGFLDGKAGFLRSFFQCLWYRILVDAKIYEVKKNCGSDKEKIKEYFRTHYGFTVNVND